MGVSSVNSNSAMSSIYGSRNVISGLASGMDTESMIENAISGLKTKIQNLQKSRTKSEWKTEAMRNISDAMVQFARKYTSYTSSTNLLSPSFFDKAVLTSAQGANSKYVTASGRSNSDIQIKGIEQLASAARYSTKSGGVLAGIDSSTILASGDGKDNTTGIVDLLKEKPVSTVDGMLTINYGKKQVSISFDELELFKTEDGKSAAENMAAAIKKKLGEEKVIMTDGSQKAADELINVSVSDSGEISFSDKTPAGNSVYISNASGHLKETLGIQSGEDSKSFTVPTGADESKLVDESKTALEYMSGKSMKVTWNGITKSIKMPEIEATHAEDGSITGLKINGESVSTIDSKTVHEKFIGGLNSSLAHAFGAGNVKVEDSDTTDAGLRLKFSTGSAGSTLAIESKFGSVLGMSDAETSYLNTGKKLSDLFSGRGENFFDQFKKIKANLDDGAEPKDVTDKDGNHLYFQDKDGNRVKKDGDNWYLVDSEDKFMFNMEINGVNIGKYSENTALETVMVDINNNAEAGVKVSYSKLTNEMVFTSKETGAGGQIEIKDTLSDGSKNIAAEIFGKKLNAPSGKLEVDPDHPTMFTDEMGNVFEKLAEGKFKDADGNVFTQQADGSYKDQVENSYAQGNDAKVKVSINGTDMEIVRSTNNFDLEGMSVTLKDKFGYDDTGAYISGTEAITFKTESDTEKIVDAVKSMVEDYNEMIKSIKDAYSTMPAQKANKTRYEPLTDEQMEGMTETEIKNYEEKAKQGLLFADSDLSSLYSKLRNVFSASGADGAYLRKIGITTNYSEGLTTVELDENALKDALNSNPDAVKDAFTKTKGTGGATTDGIMQGLKTQLDAYASTTGAYKGILIEKAGSKYSATSLLSNSYQKEMDSIDKQIDKWQDKISDKVDYYTNKFSKLEQLIAQMNSQSSYLMSLQTGG